MGAMKKMTMEPKAKHTPMPWHRMGLSIMDAENAEKQAKGATWGVDCIAFVNRTTGTPDQTQWHDEQAQANAEFIVRAVNSHEPLLEAAKLALEFFERTDKNGMTLAGSWIATGLRSAISKAEEKS